MQKTDQYCSACYPSKVRSHKQTYFFDFLDTLFEVFSRRRAIPQLPRFPAWFSATHWIHCFMGLIRIVKFSREFDKKDHYPRSWVMIQEAIKKNIPIESLRILNRITTYYRVRLGSKSYYFDGVPSRFLNFHLDDKGFTKKKLSKNGFPVSAGRVFWKKKHGLKYGVKLGFPLAVKPARGTHAYHVTAPVNNKQELSAAIALVKQYQPRFVVERYLLGSLYRVTVIDFEHVFSARREAPNVIGDGKSTIRELIEIKNSDARRGETGQKDTTLHKISSSSRDGAPPLDDVPPQGSRVFLYHKISIGSGGDVLEETPFLHPENREMFRRAARLFGADLIGFDVIAEDLSRPYTEQQCGIIEANSIPMLDFHHNPSEGAPQNAAAALWDGILADKRVRYLHPVMLAERSLFTRLIWHMMDVGIPLVVDLLIRFRIVRVLSRRQRFLAGWLRPGVSPEAAITRLKQNNFEVMRPEWIDNGEIGGLRKLLDAKRQCHIRFFNDGEIRAHCEYAPEARPIAHLLERNFHPARDIVYEYLDEFIDQNRPIVPKKRRHILRWKKSSIDSGRGSVIK